MLLLVTITTQPLFAQQLTGSSGSSFKNAGLQIDFAVGEIAIASFQQATTQISQGIMQPTYQVNVAANDLFDKTFSLKAFPNPTNGWLQIETDFNDFNNYSIINSHGKMVCKAPFQYQSIDLSFLPKGMYFLHLYSQKGIFKNIKIEVL